MASKSTLLLVLAICACTHAGQLSSESLSTEDYPSTAVSRVDPSDPLRVDPSDPLRVDPSDSLRVDPSDPLRVDPSDPLRVDIVCEAMCVARCLANNSTVPERRNECGSLCKNNSTWPMDKCASTVHPSFDNATQQPEWPLDKPMISEVTLVGNRTVLRWEFKNCTNCPTDNMVAIVRYSRDLKKWNYHSIVVKTANQTISLSLQRACAKYFQIGLVNEFGISSLSEMKTMGPVQVIKDQVQVVNVSVDVTWAHFINVQLSWQFTSELFQDAVIFLDVVKPNCAGEQVDPSGQGIPCEVLANNSVTNNREVTLREALARGNFHVLHKLYGSLWGCYDMQPVFFNYTYECSKILEPMKCWSIPQTSTLDTSTVHTTNYNMGDHWNVLVEWEAIKPHPNEVVYGYAVQWGKLLDKAPGDFFPELQPVEEFNIPGVENNSAWLRGLKPGEYGVRVFVNTSEPSINFDNVATREFTVEAAIDVSSPRGGFESSSSATVTVILVVVISFASVFLIVCLFLTLPVCRRRYRKSRMSKGGLHLNEQSMSNVYSITPAADSPEPPIPDRWEIPFERLEMGDMIGKGQFGIVMKAVIAGKLPTQYVSGSSLFRESLKRHNVQVAVKMLHGDVDDHQRQEFRREMKLMKDISYHSNLVSLLGCCTFDATPLCLIVEHCCYGDLLQYLRAHRGLMVRNEKGEKLDDVNADALTPNDLLSFARQIARGMEYLSQKGFVHRDLAARNVMVAEDKTVKIGDFGLTRYVFDDSIYVHRRGGKLPIKWMSVEALFDQVFTIWNDVWSFGVLLFELVTLGASPYPGIHNKDIPCMLKSGDRMQRPENCSEVLYAIMIACWHPCPEERPTFTHLRNKLEALLEENTPYLDLDFCQNYSHYPFFEISEEPESDQELAGEGEGEESGTRSDVIPLDAMDESLGDEPADGELLKEDLALELETCQPMLETTMSESRQDEKAFGRELQKRDSGLGSGYLCGSRHTTMEDIPLM